MLDSLGGLIRRVLEEIQYQILRTRHSLSALFNRHPGVTSSKRKPELIVSLTTIPERIKHVHLCLDSLLTQSLKPDRLILWVDENNDPARPSLSRTEFPVSVSRLTERGLEIRWSDDIGPFQKIIPALRAFPDALIATADDDRFYPRHWLRKLYHAYCREPHLIHCHRAHSMRFGPDNHLVPYCEWNLSWKGNREAVEKPSLRVFPTGVGGVLYAPGHLNPEVLNEQVFRELCPRSDDVWLKAMSLLNKTLCKKVPSRYGRFPSIRMPRERELAEYNISQGGNDRQIAAVFRHYGLSADSFGWESPLPGIPRRNPGSKVG